MWKKNNSYHERINGRIVNLKTSDKLEAYAVIARLTKGPVLQNENTHHLLGRFMELYTKEKGDDKTRCALKHLKPYEKIPVSQLDTKVVDDYLLSIKKRSMASYNISLCAFFNWMIAQKIIHPDAHRLTTLKQNNKKRVLGDSEIQKLLGAADGFWPDAIKIFLQSGVRRSEYYYAEIGDMDFERRTWLIKGKRNQDGTERNRLIPLPDVITEEFHFVDGRYLCPRYVYMKELSDQFREIRNKAKLKGVTIHTLRHTFATRMLEEEVDSAIIQEWLGHADIQTTLGYLHVTTKHMAKHKNKINWV